MPRPRGCLLDKVRAKVKGGTAGWPNPPRTDPVWAPASSYRPVATTGMVLALASSRFGSTTVRTPAS